VFLKVHQGSKGESERDRKRSLSCKNKSPNVAFDNIGKRLNWIASELFKGLNIYIYIYIYIYIVIKNCI